MPKEITESVIDASGAVAQAIQLLSGTQHSMDEPESLGAIALAAREGLDNLIFLGKWLGFAFFLESLMLAYVPAEVIASVLGGQGVWPVFGTSRYRQQAEQGKQQRKEQSGRGHGHR